MTTATPSLSLDAAMAARRSPQQQKSRRLLLWRDLLTSLWAPVSVLGLAFIPYLLVIEFVPSSAAWAQPAIQYLALLLLVAFVALLAWRLISPRERTLRQLRQEARDLIAENERILKRLNGKPGPKVAEKIAEQALEVEAACASGNAAELRKELKALDELTNEHLGPYRKQSVLDFALGFGKVLLLAAIIRVFIIEPYRIPSGSMLPTLEIGDQVFINKFLYGVRLPFTNWVPFQIVRPPARGDVIVFNNPADPEKDFIKRVIGVPGDKVVIKGEVIYINGVPQQRRKLGDDVTVFNQDSRSGYWFPERKALYEEELDGSRHQMLQDLHHPHAQREEGPYEVPANHVFVMGDNRDNSLDSRYGLGDLRRGVEYVPYGHIKGKAMVVWLALGYDGWLSRFFGGTGLRTDRLFEPVR
jgi:signal peptidase I